MAWLYWTPSGPTWSRRETVIEGGPERDDGGLSYLCCKSHPQPSCSTFWLATYSMGGDLNWPGMLYLSSCCISVIKSWLKLLLYLPMTLVKNQPYHCFVELDVPFRFHVLDKLNKFKFKAGVSYGVMPTTLLNWETYSWFCAQGSFLVEYGWP